MWQTKQPSRDIKRRHPAAGFTLVEMILVLGIVALLMSLLFPQWQKIRARANSIACTSNLRQIGIAVNLAATDNDGAYPMIETDPSNPIYPADAGAKSMAEALKDYGIEAKTLRCPADALGQNYFAKNGTSYEWRPYLDNESTADPQLYFGTRAVPVSSARVRLVTDVDAVHQGHQNRLYGDGHVVGY